MGRDASGRPDAAPSLVPLAPPPGLVRVVQPGAVYIGADGVPMMAVAHPGPPLGAHPPPPAPPPAPPAPLAALERACVLAASALAREGHRVSYQAVAARVCASRGATTLAQLGVSDPVAQVPVLEKIWRAQRVVDAHVDAYLGARSIACLLELERDLVDLLRSCCFAPLPRVTAETPPPRDPDEIALPGDDDDAHEADGAPRDEEPVLDRTHGSDFASFGLGRIEAIPAVAAAFGFPRRPSDLSAPTAPGPGFGSRGFFSGADAMASLADFLERGVEPPAPRRARHSSATSPRLRASRPRSTSASSCAPARSATRSRSRVTCGSRRLGGRTRRRRARRRRTRRRRRRRRRRRARGDAPPEARRRRGSDRPRPRPRASSSPSAKKRWGSSGRPRAVATDAREAPRRRRGGGENEKTSEETPRRRRVERKRAKETRAETRAEKRAET